VDVEKDTVSFEVPATGGGIVALTADAKLNGKPLMRIDAGSHWQIESDVKWTPVLAKQIYYKCSWQAWRTMVERSDQPRKFSVRVNADAPPLADISYHAYLVPQ
jgi:hypothetical protein